MRSTAGSTGDNPAGGLQPSAAPGGGAVAPVLAAPPPAPPGPTSPVGSLSGGDIRSSPARDPGSPPGRRGPRPRDLLVWGLAATVLAIGIILCALALVVLASATSLLGGGPLRPVGERLGQAVEQTSQELARAGQAAADTLDPTHPPREALRQDAEFDALQVVGVGEVLGQTAGSRLELASIARRADAASPDTAQYAVVRRTLVAPRPREVLGLRLGEERGEREHYLYKGQSFRLGSAYYKVNWVSVDRQQVAIARYRSADGLLGKLAFEYD